MIGNIGTGEYFSLKYVFLWNYFFESSVLNTVILEDVTEIVKI